MAASAGTVTLQLDANSVKLLRELQKAQKQTQNTARRMQSSMTKAFQSIRTSALSAASAFGVFAAARTIRGIADAGLQMERLERGLKTATGSAQKAADEIKYLREESERLGINFAEAAGSYTKLAAAAKGTALTTQDLHEGFTSVAEAAAVLGLSAEQTGGALTAIEQIISKGKVSAEELRGQLGERLPGAFQIAARAMGKTTQELDKMLQQGALLSDVFLPKFFAEIRKTFKDGVEDSANSAQAAFNRMANSIFDLKVAFASSGLLDILASMADHLATSARAVGDFLTTTLKERQAELTKTIAQLEEMNRLSENPYEIEQNNAVLETARAELSLTNDRLAREQAITKEREAQANLIAPFDLSGSQFQPLARSEASSTFFDNYRKQGERALKNFIDGFKTDEQKVQEDLATLRRAIAEGLVPDPAEQARIRKEILDTLRIDEIDPKEFAPLKQKGSLMDGMKTQFDQIREYAKQAARDSQQAWADFFFDPFEDGLRGLLKSFVDTLRRMYANQLAVMIGSRTTSNGGILSNLFSIFGGGKAAGGPVAAGVAYTVGEKGPETFVPSQNGVIVPHTGAGMMPAITFITNISADAGPDVRKWGPLLDQNNRKMKAELIDEINRGKYDR